MNYSDLLVLKDEALTKISDETFCAKFVDDAAYGEIFFF